MAQRLHLSKKSKVIAGVCGGLGEYFDIDPVIVRILAVLLLFASGIGLVAYIVCWIAMPQETSQVEVIDPTEKSEPPAFRRYLPGIILIFLGVFFLLQRFFWWFHWRHIWPMLLILAGVLLIWKAVSHRSHNGGYHESVEN